MKMILKVPNRESGHIQVNWEYRECIKGKQKTPLETTKKYATYD